MGIENVKLEIITNKNDAKFLHQVGSLAAEYLQKLEDRRNFEFLEIVEDLDETENKEVGEEPEPGST